ncbi:MAG: hypothetical protein BA862_00710 [Desulfobulbaceae bacterium S3730MH12]|nr:MAG: hypothetical protein BA866_02750 [Desulfobulbaceae bacterium S5133MH15]OEU57468.1 MAG: hypothetical protein BA862_00710 [Desulfobulbaceae bacterium S3730MH12]
MHLRSLVNSLTCPQHSFIMIGFFNSEIGELTVARAVKLLWPKHPFLCPGDISRTPPGNKNTKIIVQYSNENTTFLVENLLKTMEHSAVQDLNRSIYLQPA